jgi:hypothetical protein
VAQSSAATCEKQARKGRTTKTTAASLAARILLGAVFTLGAI